MYFEKVALQFIPIILLFLLLSYSKNMTIFSHTILGKLIAIGLIILYTTVDKYTGLFVCSLIILYYQFDFVESMLNMDLLDSTPEYDTATNDDLIDDHLYIEGFSQIQNNFVQENCKKGVLTYKNMDVKPDMAEHVFQELKFIDDSPCNVCSNTCGFSIIESKLSKESDLHHR